VHASFTALPSSDGAGGRSEFLLFGGEYYDGRKVRAAAAGCLSV